MIQMEKLFNEETIAQVKQMLQPMTKDVNFKVFTKEGAPSVVETVQLMTEFGENFDHINVDFLSIEEHTDIAEQYNVSLVPTIVALDSDNKDRGVRFVGVPLGHEINSLLATTLELGQEAPALPQDVIEKIKAIDKPTNIKVFVTLGCPHCPGAVHKAHQMAMLNDNIEAEMVEAQTFNELSMKHNVSSVPHIVINDGKSFVGNQPIETFINESNQA